MGAYLRFAEKRIEKALRRTATRGVIPPVRVAPPVPGTTGADRRPMIPYLGLREYWYPALPDSKVPAKKPLYWRMLGDEIAFFRAADGSVAAVSDICPHRGASMAQGACFYKGTISCPYHGATFDAAGECKAFLPEGPDSTMPGNLKIRSYPTRTLRGWVFIWMGEGTPAPIEEDVPPELFDEKSTVFFTTYTYWDCNWMLAIENQNDSHNGFFVHRNSVMQLMMYRGRGRTPLGPRSKLVHDRALIPLMKNQGYYRDADGKDSYQLYYPGVDGHWPIGTWRKWLWGLFKPWYKLVYNRWRMSEPRYPYKSPSEEWAQDVGASAWHLPCMVRVNFGAFAFTRSAVPVTENLSRVVYFHHRRRAGWKVAQWIQKAWFYGYFNWWLHYNFSGQDRDVAAPCRYWTEENLSPTDSHLVMLRKLVTERSRDAKRAAALAEEGRAAKETAASKRASDASLDVSLDEASSLTERAPALEFVVGRTDKP